MLREVPDAMNLLQASENLFPKKVFLKQIWAQALP
jgi:hypothetical protein